MRKNGQSSIDYLLVLTIIVGAFVGMHVYITRGVQGRMKTYADQLSNSGAYSPRATLGSLQSGLSSRLDKTITEVSESYSVDTGSDTSVGVSRGDVSVSQITIKSEETLPLDLEPVRR